MGAVEDLRRAGDWFAAHSAVVESQIATAEKASALLSAVTGARTAFEAAHLAGRTTEPGEIDAVLDDLHQQLVDAGLAEHAATLSPADMLRVALEAVADAHRQSEMVTALKRASLILTERLAAVGANFSAGAKIAGPRSPAARQQMLVEETLQQARDLLAPFLTLDDDAAKDRELGQEEMV